MVYVYKIFFIIIMKNLGELFKNIFFFYDYICNKPTDNLEYYKMNYI